MCTGCCVTYFRNATGPCLALCPTLCFCYPIGPLYVSVDTGNSIITRGLLLLSMPLVEVNSCSRGDDRGREAMLAATCRSAPPVSISPSSQGCSTLPPRCASRVPNFAQGGFSTSLIPGGREPIRSVPFLAAFLGLDPIGGASGKCGRSTSTAVRTDRPLAGALDSARCLLYAFRSWRRLRARGTRPLWYGMRVTGPEAR